MWLHIDFLQVWTAGFLGAFLISRPLRFYTLMIVVVSGLPLFILLALVYLIAWINIYVAGDRLYLPHSDLGRNVTPFGCNILLLSCTKNIRKNTG